MQAVSAVTALPTVPPTPHPPSTRPSVGTSSATSSAALGVAAPGADGPVAPRAGLLADAAPARAGARRRGRSYRELAAWQRAVELSVACHELARRLPAAEAAGLGRSICEAADTLAANVAQGHERLLRADYVQHLSIARGNLQRLETLLEVAGRLHYLDLCEAAALDRRCTAVGRHLSLLIRSVYGIGGTSHGTAARGAAGRATGEVGSAR